MPAKYFSQAVSNELMGKWKYTIRKRLVQRYEIVGSIGDRDIDFTGDIQGIL